MKGLLIWAWSDCRSAFALYEEIRKQIGAPCEIVLWHPRSVNQQNDMRRAVGFDDCEFADVETTYVGENWERGLSVLDAHPGWHHIFGVYQVSPVFRRLLLEASRRGEHVAVMSESPCEMNSGCRALVHKVYVRYILPLKVRNVIWHSDFFINFSGDSVSSAERLGWPVSKIIPFGYFPPPVPNTKCVRRHFSEDDEFVILSTGILSRYRGADVLVDALRMLADRGVKYRAVITQSGELMNSLKEKVSRHGLRVEFPGKLSLSEVSRAYENCSVYVGTGRSEPWGMRLNDALNCGAPIVVSRGMGGVQLVDRYGCGLAFDAGDSGALAEALEALATDRNVYERCAEKAVLAARLISPAGKAKELLTAIAKKNTDWKWIGNA